MIIARAGDVIEGAAQFLKSLSGWRRAFAAFLGGAFAALAQAPLNIWPLMAVGFCVLILLLDAAPNMMRPKRSAFFMGWLFGFGYFLAGIYWMAFSFFVQAEQFAWMAPFAVTGLPAFLALFTGAAALAASYFWRDGWRRIVVFAGFWLIFEYLRGHVLTGLPWNLSGQALAGSALTAQTAAWYGAYGLSLVTVLLSAAPAAWVGYRLPAKRALLGSLMLVAGFAGLAGVGYIRLLDGAASSEPQAYVRIVQPNIPQKEKIDPDLWGKNFYRQLELSKGGAPR